MASTVARGVAAGDVGLIGADDDQVAGLLEPAHGVLNAGQETKLGERGRRNGFAVALEVGVDDAVAIEKDGRPHHLVAFRCSFGCETRQCQTTAWNASACGVTRDSSTVGMTTTTSPAFFV